MLAAYKTSDRMSAVEQNQQAQADYKRAQLAILERDHIPIGEAREACARIGSIVSDVIEGSELDMEAQNLLFARVKEALEAAFEEDKAAQ